MSTEVDVRVKVTGAKKAAEEVSEVGKAANESNEAASQLTSSLDKMTGGIISGFQGVVKGLKTGVAGLKTFKAALVTTGIGALVVAVGSLVSYFTKTQRGAEMLEVASAALSTAFGVIIDKVSALGEWLINAFKNPKQAIMDFYQTLKTYVMDQVQKLMDGFSLLGDAIGHVFAGEFNKAKDAAVEGAKKIGDAAIPTSRPPPSPFALLPLSAERGLPLNLIPCPTPAAPRPEMYLGMTCFCLCPPPPPPPPPASAPSRPGDADDMEPCPE